MTETFHLLLVEDSADDALLLVQNLEQAGYAPVVRRVDTAEEMARALAAQTWHLVIADHTMPGFSGNDALELVKKSGLDLPFIFVSGTIGEERAVAAMKAGAHDYIMKDNLNRLVPAIERELREAGIRRERNEAQERLRYLAYHDPLTELPNYTFFCDRLDEIIRLRMGEEERFALLIMELNRFKSIRATLGYHITDLLLKQVGRRLKEQVAEPDLVACLRTNEFALLLPSVTDEQQAAAAVERLLGTLELPLILNDLKLEIQASFGIALFPQHGTNVNWLIQRAHTALSTARREFGKYATYSVEQDRNDTEQLMLVGDLRRAIVENQLFLLYQPKVELATGKVLGAEALVRWKHPDLGLIVPDRFIPLAENTGLIMPLTLWVLREATQQCRAWNAAGLKLTVAVNLSMQNLHARELPDQIAGVLNSQALPAANLQVEITETAIMANPALALENIQRMKAMGLRFSIDDFGTGYSSLAYLKRLPIDEIKIDKSFVLQMTSHEEDAVIVNLIIELGHKLGFKLVAEGVENRPALELLVKMGCDMAQGYYISRPIPAADFTSRFASLSWHPD